MQILLTETKAKETKTATLQNKRNLFGLGVTSLIAACGADNTAGTGDGDDKTPTMETPIIPVAKLPFKAVKLEKAPELSGTEEGKSGFTAITDGGDTTFIAKIGGANTATLHFDDGGHNSNNSVKIYQLTATDTQYDLVVSSFTIDTALGNNSESRKGRVFIFWDVADIKEERIGKDSETRTNQRLEIKGAAANDLIGSFAPDFLQIDGTVNNYDMVFAGRGVDRVSGNSTNEGAIYILWDVADYAGATKTIDLGNLDVADVGDVLGLGATAGSLTIYGKIAEDNIGINAPQLLELGGADDAYDMVIRSQLVNKTKAGEGEGDIKNEGAMYILWDVTGYHDTKALHKTVTLDNSLVDDSGAYANGATYGLLAIYGAIADDQTGSFAPKLLQIAGKTDNYDMVIRSFRADKVGDGKANTGAIYILWDVADYAGKNKTIDLGNLDVADVDDVLGLGATAGSLTIYGAQIFDVIGTHAPEFLQIGGKDGYDMVIRSDAVDKVGASSSGTDEGAIYILWDVADYYSAGTDKNKTIDLATPDDASSGLLTIYGRAGAKLGEGNKDILYDNAGELTNIDGDAAGTKDIALTDGMYTYVFFGDKIANDGNDNDDKIDSKTIDLGTLDGALSVGMAGFFEYDFTANNGLGSATTKTATKTTDSVGYRYANDDHTTLAAIALNPPPFSAMPLSDTDADLGVWDIA